MAELIILDVETQHLADEVGGWANIEAMRLSVAVTWDADNGYRTWWEGQAGDLLEELGRADLIVGYNVSAFDYRVLALYGCRPEELSEKTFDILEEIFQQCGRLVGLSVVAKLNLGEAKSLESGADAVQLWRDGRLEDLAAYCQRDVELTKRLYEFWQDQGLLWIRAEDFAVWPGPAGEETG